MPRSRRASRSSSSTARASSNRSITAWLSEPRLNRPRPASSAAAGPIPSPRSRSVVGQKQTPVDVCVEVGDVVRRSGGWRAPRWSAGPRTPASRRSAVGVRPCTARHCSTSAVCSEECTCSGAPCACGPVHDGRHLRRAGTPRTECSAAPTSTPGRPLDLRLQRVDALRPTASPVPSPNRCCGPSASGAPSDAGAQIAGVEQRHPDTGVARRRRSARGPWRSGRRSGAPPASWCR